MIWVAYVIAAALLAVASPAPERKALYVFALGLVSVFIAKNVLGETAFWLFSAFIWIWIGWLVTTITGGKLALSALWLVAAGLLVVPARLWGAYEVGNPFLVVSDLCGIAYLAGVGRFGFARIVAGIGRLGGYNRNGLWRYILDCLQDSRGAAKVKSYNER